MAKNTPVDESTEQTPTTPVAPQVDLSMFGAVIGEAVAKGIAANTRKKVTIGEYVARGGNSSFHPDPKVKVKMSREYYQNGKLIEHASTFDNEILLLNQLTHSGRYIDRLVEVVVIQNGSEEAVDIRFSNKVQFAFELKGKARDFEDMLRQIVAAQAIEREDMADDKADRAERAAKRKEMSFGAGKASREAREKAGV